MNSIAVASPEEMEAFGRRLAGVLRPGDIVVLEGSLGSGKTLLASGVGQGLGVETQVTSPTFLVVKPYSGLLPLYHADVYRLNSTAEFSDLELVAAAADGVLLIEWGSAVRGALPADILTLRIEIGADGVRTVSVQPEGEWRNRPLEEFGK